MSIKNFILFVFLCCWIKFSSGQIREKTLELGFFAGSSNYIGDLAPNIVIKESQPAIGISIKKNVSPYFAYGAQMNFGTISGNDNDFKSLSTRNLNFKSNIFEISPQMEFSFFPFAVGINKGKFTPYLFVGLSVFYFDPKTTYHGDTYRLQPLSTEGQGLIEGAPAPYNLWQVAIPFGGGVKLNIAERWNIAFSSGFRATFTDYLDDVSGTYADKQLIGKKKGNVAMALSDRSGEFNDLYTGLNGKQRGDSQLKDWYVFTGFTISYIIKQGPCYRFRKSIL